MPEALLSDADASEASKGVMTVINGLAGLMQAAATPSEALSPPEALPFEVVPIPGKGQGCRAIRDIAQGERIFAEVPLIKQGPGLPSLNAAVDALSFEERRMFFALTQNELRWGVAPSARGIFATNAHPCHAYNLLHRGIFPTVARFNHACDSCAVYRWNENIGKLTVHAARGISEGEEICVCYSFDGMLREQRQRHLRELFGFSCTCSKCSLRGAELAQSDARLEAIGDVSSCVKEMVHHVPKGTAHQLHEGIYLRSIAKLEPTEFLQRLDERFFLLRDEFPPNGHVDGVECFLQAFVELCERAAAKLIKLAEAAEARAEAPQAPKGGNAANTTAESLRAKAAEYVDAA